MLNLLLFIVKYLLIIVNWFSKSLEGSGLGVILRSLRNSPFVKQEHHATASADSHPVATRYLSFSASYARAKERTQVQAYSAFLTRQS